MPDTSKGRARTGSPTGGVRDPWRPGLVTFSEVRFERSRWWLVSVALGLLAISLLESIFLVSDTQPRRWLFALGCLAVVLTGSAALVAWIRDRDEVVDLVPTTVLGWWSLVMPPVGAVWILIVLASGGLEVNLLAFLVVLVGLAVAGGSTALALLAVLKHRERSLLVIVLGLAPAPLAVFLLLGYLGLSH